jgi:hypothetical protein
MRFMNIVRTTENSPLGPPPKALMDAIDKLGEEATKAGVFVETGGLMPSAAGARLRLTGGKLTVTDGPFSEAKEVIGGFAVFDVKSKAEAVEWARRFMNLHTQHWPGWEGEAEVRQLMDFASRATAAA